MRTHTCKQESNNWQSVIIPHAIDFDIKKPSFICLYIIKAHIHQVNALMWVKWIVLERYIRQWENSSTVEPTVSNTNFVSLKELKANCVCENKLRRVDFILTEKIIVCDCYTKKFRNWTQEKKFSGYENRVVSVRICSAKSKLFALNWKQIQKKLRIILN